MLSFSLAQCPNCNTTLKFFPSDDSFYAIYQCPNVRNQSDCYELLLATSDTLSDTLDECGQHLLAWTTNKGWTAKQLCYLLV